MILGLKVNAVGEAEKLCSQHFLFGCALVVWGVSCLTGDDENCWVFVFSV